MNKEVAVLGVGMHPWGKWGQSFVGYGVKAAQDALRFAAEFGLTPSARARLGVSIDRAVRDDPTAPYLT